MVHPYPTMRLRPGAKVSGFTLIEMAVALFVITLLLGSLMVPLTTQVESRNQAETQRILEQAREALIGFAATNGRFPCPATAASSGAEDFGVGGSAANGICDATATGANVYYGFLPAVTLGFTPVDDGGYAVDAWGISQNRIRYAVSSVTVNGIFRPFTSTNGMKNAGMSNVMAATNLLYVCNSATGASATIPPYCTTSLAASVPVVIWSVGSNAATTGGAGADEQQNPNPSANPQSFDRIFVYRTKAGGSIEFDDIVTWISPASLFHRMIAAGQLP